MSILEKVALGRTRKAQALISENYMLCDVDVNEAIATLNPNRLNIPTYTTGFSQIETATVAGTITANPGGNATITVKSKLFADVVLSVALLLNDDANAIATKIRTALSGNATITTHFTVGGATDKVMLTAIVPAQHDYILNIGIAVGTATGLTAASTSANTLTGSKDEIVHPSILFFPHGWNGYKYWLGYTCFDNGSSAFENPCIAVSNDNITWIAPPGLTNPVEPQPQSGYYADINLFMSPDEQTMYMVFKYANVGAQTYLRSSTDGVNWTEKVLLFSNSFEDVSPSVLWDGTQYKMWTLKHADNPNGLYLRTAPKAEGPWSAPTLCTLNGGTEIWHLEVRKVGSQYHILVSSNTSSIYPLWFGKSDDGINWTFSKTSIFKRGALNTINYSIYKPTFFPMITDKGIKYGLWYGTSVPYYVCYTEIEFNRTTLKQEYNNNILQSKIPLSPWILGDTFDRADDASALGVADSGQTWTNVLGSAFGINNKKAYLTSAVNSRSIINIGIADFYTEVTITAGTIFWLLFRYVDTNNMWRIGCDGGGNELYLQKIISGTLTRLTKGLPVAPFTVGDRVGVECYGNIISVYVNGRKMYEITDADANTGTSVGLNCDNVTTRYDDFIARALY
jgi:hypothetical protein